MDESEAVDHQIASMTVSESDLVYAYTDASYQRASMTVSENGLAYMYTKYCF